MSITKDTTASFERIRGYGNQMKSLLSRHQVHSIDDLKRVAKDSAFKSEVAIWEGIIRAEGGKISLTLILGTIAIAMGGVGIAAGGSAIGLPLILILAPLGYFGAQELDSEGYTKAVVDIDHSTSGALQRISARYKADHAPLATNGCGGQDKPTYGSGTTVALIPQSSTSRVSSCATNNHLGSS